MILGMTVKTNADIAMISAITFELATGSKLEVDRKSTDYEIKGDNEYFVQFHDVYLWSLDGHHIFSDQGHLLGSHLDYEVDEFDWLTKKSKITVDYYNEYLTMLEDNDEEDSIYFDVLSFAVY